MSTNIDSFEMTKVGVIAQNNDFIIYGYYNNCLIFYSSKSQDYSYSNKLEYNLVGNLSCKYIEDDNFVCALITNNILTIICLNYNINILGSSILDSYENSKSIYYEKILDVCLYDTEKNNIKLLCGKFETFTQCKFIDIKFENNKSIITFFGSDSLTFDTKANNILEKDCFISVINSEYLICCAIINYIKCYRINYSTYELIREFQISIPGTNTYLTINNNNINNDYFTLFFMNRNNEQNSIYEYYIYLPSCEDKNYSILNSLNEYKSEENFEKISNLFTVKTNKYYFEIKYFPDEYGYFTLNNEIIKNKTLISNNNFTFDFFVTNKEITSNKKIIVNYIVSIEGDDAYSNQCQIELSFKSCYNSCFNCSLDINNSNETQHNCIVCKKNYYFSPLNQSNCYLIEEKELNWYFDSSNSKFGICDEECKTCTGPSKSDCTLCSDGYYPENITCTENYSQICLSCKKCYQNCNTCYDNGNSQKMNCETCKENKIKYQDNCFDIENSTIKTFYEPKNNNSNITSCYKKYGLYIKEDSNNCINLTDENDGYYISNNDTGLLSKCHENCLSCKSGPIYDDLGNIKTMGCLKCKNSTIKNNNGYSFLDNTGNCYDNTNQVFDEHEATLSDFKNEIKNNITSYINSTKVINGSNFMAIIISSDDINPEEQIKNGISPVDLGNCIDELKKYYNISDNENLILVNMESKIENSNNDDKAINLGKNTEIDVYDYSGRKLNISICKEEIKIMKLIDDFTQIDINSAKSLSEQGVDVFNPKDEFFNNICYQYENTLGTDIILNDRRTDIYQNVTFCQDGCSYNGVNYSLMVANCLCDSSSLQVDNDNITRSEIDKEENTFKSFTKSFIENLFSFNFEVTKCYNLILNKKILANNIGFYCLSSMVTLQLIFLFIYLIKRLKPVKNFMINFIMNNFRIANMNYNKNNKNINHITNINKKKKKKKSGIKAMPPPKNNFPKKNNKKENSNKKKKKVTKSKITESKPNKNNKIDLKFVMSKNNIDSISSIFKNENKDYGLKLPDSDKLENSEGKNIIISHN